MKNNHPPYVLTVQQVSHQFGELPVIRHFQLAVRPQEIVVIVGPSGCGKTTLLNIMAGHVQPSAGTVQHRGTVRTIYQQNGLFPWMTVRENISMGFRSAAGSRVDTQALQALIRSVQLDGFEQYYPHQLSGGMKQRVELARALAGNSDILLMDEPFSSLDYQARLHLRLELVRLLEQHRRALVLVTHDVEEAAQLADRVVILTQRPATVQYELCIDLPRPRRIGQPGLTEAMQLILQQLGFTQATDGAPVEAATTTEIINQVSDAVG